MENKIYCIQFDNTLDEVRKHLAEVAFKLGMFAEDIGNNFTIKVYGTETQFKQFNNEIFGI